MYLRSITRILVLATVASRAFYITPSDTRSNVTLPAVNVGVTADSARAELVALATILDAKVPPESVRYTNNANGSVTVEFIQTDRILLPRSSVREIHEFDPDLCLITKITGYVHGPVVCSEKTGIRLVDKVYEALAKS